MMESVLQVRLSCGCKVVGAVSVANILLCLSRLLNSLYTPKGTVPIEVGELTALKSLRLSKSIFRLLVTCEAPHFCLSKSSIRLFSLIQLVERSAVPLHGRFFLQLTIYQIWC